MSQSRTPLLQALQQAFRKSLLEHDAAEPPLKREDANGSTALLDRRKFLSDTIKAGLSVGGLYLASQSYIYAAPAGTAPVIAIVGGGLAGLNAAYQLKKFGFRADIYEAGDSLGGRIHTARNILGNNLTTEVGGEFVDTGHADMWSLIKEFQIPYYDCNSLSERRLIKDDYLIDGVRYRERQVVAEFRHFSRRIKKDQDSVPDDLSYKTPLRGRSLDQISIDEYLDEIGARGWFLSLLKNAFTGEFGLDTGEQSALNFITMIGTDTSQNKLEMYGESDERYKIKGGSDLVISKLVARLKDQIKTGHKLEAIGSNANGFTLDFQNRGPVKADYVILAIPFTTLRQVNINLDLPQHKQRAIRELGYGTNSKMVFGFNQRIWRKLGYSGYLFSDVIHNGWDNSQMQNNNLGPGGYTAFLGGRAGRELSMDERERYLAVVDKAYRGAAASFNGQSRVFNWSQNPLTQGSYACYKVGQWTSIGGAEIEPVGNLLFAGEHCSRDYQGFMNGAAETGRTAAVAILQRLRRPRRRARFSRAA
jgi:monoamine oxidase